MVLKMSIKNHLGILGFAISTLAVTFGIWIYLSFDMKYFIAGFGVYTIFTIPALLIHISYYRKNKGEEIEISSNEIVIRKSGLERRYQSKDLAKIVIVKPASLDNWGIPLSAMDYYHYVRIVTRENEEIYITCLMSTKVDQIVKQLRGVEFHRKKGLALLNWRD